MEKLIVKPAYAWVFNFRPHPLLGAVEEVKDAEPGLPLRQGHLSHLLKTVFRFGFPFKLSDKWVTCSKPLGIKMVIPEPCLKDFLKAEIRSY